MIERSSLQIDINSNPGGADVYVKPYRSPDEPWTHIGVTPIEAARMPIGVFRWKLEKQGYNTVFAAASTWRVNGGPAGEDLLIANDFSRSLDAAGEVPDGMVRVPGRDTPDGSFADFLVDRFEVTNEQYQQFVDAGAYASEKNWLNTFVRNDEVLDWAEAMALFVDQTGRPGPAQWQAGTYPDAEADYPVTGVSCTRRPHMPCSSAEACLPARTGVWRAASTLN